MNRSSATAAAALPAPQPRPYAIPSVRVRELWDAENNIVRKFAFFATVALLFLKFSSIHEFLQAVTGHGLPVMYVVVPPAVLGFIGSGGLQRTFQAKASWWWMAFAVWIILGLPFSVWFGGSVQTFYMFARTELLMLFLVAGTVVTWKECRIIYICAVVSALIPISFALHYGDSGPRLNLDFQGSIANPNYLAAHLLLLLPFCIFFLFRPKTAFLLRMLGAAGTALGIYAILRTGSRGAMLSLAVGTVILLLRGTSRQRIIVLALGPVAIAGALFLIPAETLRRLTSFSADADSRLEAIQSAESREYLFKKSVEFSLQNPVFGIGMGQFSNFEGQTSRAAGERGNWHETHNAYTQVSSECGAPALLFFLAGMVSMMGIFHKLAKRAKAAGHEEMMLAANCAFLAAVVFSVAIFFLSLAYVFYLPALSGLAIAMRAAADKELAQFSAARALPGQH